MPRWITCASCERQKPPCKADPEFCRECYERIEHDRPHIVERTRAAAALVNSIASQREHKRMKMAAFLAIFHPTMSARRQRQIVNDLD